MSGRIDLEIDRDVTAGSRVHPSPALVVPLETTVIVLHCGDVAERLDRASFAIVPARTVYEVEPPASGSAIVVTLIVHPPARSAAARDYIPHVDPRVLEDVLAQLRFLPRTRWVDELVHRYVFERSVCERRNSRASRFLEAELTKEVYFLAREQLDRRERAPGVFEGDALAERARVWLEGHLFEPFHARDLVDHCHASESTVLRAFRKELGVSPLAYLRRRRLEESLQLLQSGRYTVTEVATRVGYANPSAFAAAFREEFGVSPSGARTARAIAWLPAHGAPPIRRET